MDIQKLLVADPSAAFCAALADALGSTYEIQVCGNGLDARSLLDSFQPDILVIDLTLPGLDGISVLKGLSGRGKRPAVLVTASFVSPYIESAMQALNVDYLMMKPCDMSGLADRIRDLTEDKGNVVLKAPSAVDSIANMLLALNISTKHSGFRCLEEAIVLYEQMPNQSVTKQLYPEVGKRCDGSGLSVERAIRSAIHAAWERRDERVWRMYFSIGRDGLVPRPTNTTFIATLANLLRRQHQDWAQM